jgi:hypothetical protein
LQDLYLAVLFFVLARKALFTVTVTAAIASLAVVIVCSGTSIQSEELFGWNTESRAVSHMQWRQ